MDENITTKNNVEKTGSGCHKPPKASIMRVWRRS